MLKESFKFSEVFNLFFCVGWTRMNVIQEVEMSSEGISEEEMKAMIEINSVEGKLIIFRALDKLR